MHNKDLTFRCPHALTRLLAGSLCSGLLLLGLADTIAASAPIIHRLSETAADSGERSRCGAAVPFPDEKPELRDQITAPGQHVLLIDPGVWKLPVHAEQYVSQSPEALTATDADTEKDATLNPGARLVSDRGPDGGGNDLPAVSDGTPLERSEEGASVHFIPPDTPQTSRLSPAEDQPIRLESGAKILLESLEIVGPDPPVVSNRSQVTFQCVAHDTSGQKMIISPKWRLDPPGAGAVSHTRNGETITFAPHQDFIGQVQVFLTDSISGQTVEFNTSDSLSECDHGLAVFHLLSGEAPEISVGDLQGFRLNIPAGAIPHGDTAMIFLRKPPVLDIKRITPGYQVWGHIYDVCASDDLSLFPDHEVSFDRPVELILPLGAETGSRQAVIGRWSHQDLEWTPLGGTAEAGDISVQADHLSQFAVLSASASAGLRDIQLLPNPFSPHDPYGLQLAFTLSSDQTRKPFVTIEVYNIAGELVRTICENEPLPKGTYLPGETCLDSRGCDVTRWDGRTDTGDLARNGHYVIHFRVQDGTETVEALKTAVLIK
jgi:hypothetical protein